MEQSLKDILDLIPAASGPMIGALAIVLDFGLRLFPTKKPIGVLHIVAASLKLVAEILIRCAALLDAVLPQRVIEQKPAEEKKA